MVLDQGTILDQSDTEIPKEGRAFNPFLFLDECENNDSTYTVYNTVPFDSEDQSEDEKELKYDNQTHIEVFKPFLDEHRHGSGESPSLAGDNDGNEREPCDDQDDGMKVFNPFEKSLDAIVEPTFFPLFLDKTDGDTESKEYADMRCFEPVVPETRNINDFDERTKIKYEDFDPFSAKDNSNVETEGGNNKDCYCFDSFLAQDDDYKEDYVSNMVSDSLQLFSDRNMNDYLRETEDENNVDIRSCNPFLSDSKSGDLEGHVEFSSEGEDKDYQENMKESQPINKCQREIDGEKIVDMTSFDPFSSKHEGEDSKTYADFPNTNLIEYVFEEFDHCEDSNNENNYGEGFDSRLISSEQISSEAVSSEEYDKNPYDKGFAPFSCHSSENSPVISQDTEKFQETSFWITERKEQEQYASLSTQIQTDPTFFNNVTIVSPETDENDKGSDLTQPNHIDTANGSSQSNQSQCYFETNFATDEDGGNKSDPCYFTEPKPSNEFNSESEDKELERSSESCISEDLQSTQETSELNRILNDTYFEDRDIPAWLREITPKSLMPFFEQEVSRTENESKIYANLVGKNRVATDVTSKSHSSNKGRTKLEIKQSNVRPPIIFDLQDLMEWKSGLYLSIGSSLFDVTSLEKVSNTFLRIVENKCVGKSDNFKLAKNTSKKIKQVWDALSAASSSQNQLLVEIEKWILKLQEVAIQKLKYKHFDDAILLYKRILGIYREYPRHAVTGTILHNIGIIYLLHGDSSTARQYFNPALEIRSIENGATHENILNSMNMTSLNEYKLGNTGRAKSILSGAINFMIAEHEEKHPKLAELYNNLACIYVDLMRFSPAIILLQKSYELQTQSMRSLSYRFEANNERVNERKIRFMNIATTVANIGVIHMYTKSYDKAIDAFEESMLNQSVILSPDDSLILATMDNLAFSNVESGDTGRALMIYSDLMKISAERYGPNHFKCAQIWSQVSLIQRRKGNFKRAAKCIHKIFECFALRDKDDKVQNDNFEILIEKERIILQRLASLEKLEALKSTMASF